LAFTDGLTHAGERKSQPLDLLRLLAEPEYRLNVTAEQIADRLLETAVSLDDGRPGDDVSVVAVRISAVMEDSGAEVRRLSVSFPVPGG
jgi:serine phosphatase RsbU (regulator of sigma subunit)